jgi:hypothetical protein
VLIPSPKLVGFRKRQLVKNFYKFKLDNRREPLKILSNASLLGGRGRFAAFPSRFSAAKVFYDLRLDLRIEHLSFLRGYGSGRRGQDNERDAAFR